MFISYFLMDFIVKKFSYIIQIYKAYDVNKKFIESSINFNMIIVEKKNKNNFFFQIIFQTQKQTCFNKKIQHNLKLKNIMITQLLNNIKKLSSIYFLFTV